MSPNQAVHQPSSAPTKQCTNQAVHQPSSAPTKQCTNQAVHQPSSRTNSFVGAVETTAPPCEHQPSSRTNSFVGAVLAFDGRYAQILVDATCIFQPLSL